LPKLVSRAPDVVIEPRDRGLVAGVVGTDLAPIEAEVASDLVNALALEGPARAGGRAEPACARPSGNTCSSRRMSIRSVAAINGFDDVAGGVGRVVERDNHL
jgi:hypothetical protein